ncbi:hypothetical protein EG831_07060, partial [bacterium]|nr:hypothetical protein [bacterium]
MISIAEPVCRQVAQDERLDPAFIREGVAQGTIVVPWNKHRTLGKPCAVGRGTRTKVNANIGTSQDYCGLDAELAKLAAALAAGADCVMIGNLFAGV